MLISRGDSHHGLSGSLSRCPGRRAPLPHSKLTHFSCAGRFLGGGRRGDIFAGRLRATPECGAVDLVVLGDCVRNRRRAEPRCMLSSGTNPAAIGGRSRCKGTRSPRLLNEAIAGAQSVRATSFASTWRSDSEAHSRVSPDVPCTNITTAAKRIRSSTSAKLNQDPTPDPMFCAIATYRGPGRGRTRVSRLRQCVVSTNDTLN
jgi:hypothetical protein